MDTKRWLIAAFASLLAAEVTAQTVLDSPELYGGEKALYEAAKKEGMVVSFDTGPTWANWAAQFAAFKKRYPEVEIVYNDLGSGATVVALEKAKKPSAGRHCVLFCGFRGGCRRQGSGRPLQAGQLRQAAAGISRTGRTLVHDPFADRRLYRQYQAGEERPAIVGGSAEARNTRTRWSISIRAPPVLVRCSRSRRISAQVAT
jgi:hypothetical protein